MDKWGSDFVSPVGTNVPGTATWAQFSALSIMAREDGTSVTVDANAGAAGGVTAYTLDEGESVLVQGILVGATVSAAPASGIGTRTVQVNIMTADSGSTYEGRWFSLPPTTAWDTSYYAPAGSTVTGGTNVANVFVHNPGNALISVTQADLNNPEGSRSTSPRTPRSPGPCRSRPPSRRRTSTPPARTRRLFTPSRRSPSTPPSSTGATPWCRSRR